MDGVGNVFVCVPVLEVVITRLLNRQGVDLFDIINPVVTPRDVSAAFTFFKTLSRGALFVFAVTLMLSLSRSLLQGYVVIEMDFGFPHHLLVDFLRKTLQ